MGTRSPRRVAPRYFASGRTIDEGASASVPTREGAEMMARERARFYGVGQVWRLRGVAVDLFPVATFTREAEIRPYSKGAAPTPLEPRPEGEANCPQ